MPAGAWVHRRNQHLPGRKAGDLAGAGDHDRGVLERLAQALQHMAGEFGQLVEEQHPAVGERHLARPHVGAAGRRVRELQQRGLARRRTFDE